MLSHCSCWCFACFMVLGSKSSIFMSKGLIQGYHLLPLKKIIATCLESWISISMLKWILILFNLDTYNVLKLNILHGSIRLQIKLQYSGCIEMKKMHIPESSITYRSSFLAVKMLFLLHCRRSSLITMLLCFIMSQMMQKHYKYFYQFFTKNFACVKNNFRVLKFRNMQK